MVLMEPSDRVHELTEEEKQVAIELLANKLAKNPVFAVREQQVTVGSLVMQKNDLFVANCGIWTMDGTGVYAKNICDHMPGITSKR